MIFQQEIEKLLENDENILWHQITYRNLLLILPLGILTILFWIIFMLIFTIIGILGNNILLIPFIDVFGLIALFFTLFEVIRIYKERISWENLSEKELKNYLQFEVLTDKKLIIKNYNETHKEFGLPTILSTLNKEKDVLVADLGLFTSIEFYINKVSFAIELENGGYLMEFKIKDSTQLKLLEKHVNNLFDKNMIISHI